MAAVETLAYLYDRHERGLTAALDGFDRGLLKVLDGLNRALLDLPNWDQISADLAIRQITHIQMQLRGQLNALGYDDLVRRFMTNGYDAAQVFSKTIFQALGKSELILSPMRQDIIRQLRDYDFTAFQEFGNRAIQELSKEMVLNVVGGKRRSQVIVDLKNNLDVKYSQAQVMADTALRSFDRVCQMQTYQEAGVDTFKYAGPKDSKNRLFCSARVGKVFKLAEIKKWNNGSKQFSDCLRFMGGARCRHYLLGIPEVEPNGED